MCKLAVASAAANTPVRSLKAVKMYCVRGQLYDFQKSKMARQAEARVLADAIETARSAPAAASPDVWDLVRSDVMQQLNALGLARDSVAVRRHFNKLYHKLQTVSQAHSVGTATPQRGTQMRTRRQCAVGQMGESECSTRYGTRTISHTCTYIHTLHMTPACLSSLLFIELRTGDGCAGCTAFLL